MNNNKYKMKQWIIQILNIKEWIMLNIYEIMSNNKYKFEILKINIKWWII